MRWLCGAIETVVCSHNITSQADYTLEVTLICWWFTDGCDVSRPDNGQLDLAISRVEQGGSVAYSCDSNYTKLHDEVVCQTGHFVPGPPSCVPRKYWG